jgi:hypothetical protein
VIKLIERKENPLSFYFIKIFLKRLIFIILNMYNKYTMENKSNVRNARKIGEVIQNHNKLTLLVGTLLNKINYLEKEVIDLKGGNFKNTNSKNEHNTNTNNHNHISSLKNDLHFNEPVNNSHSQFSNLKAEDILKKLSLNHIEN